MFAKLRTRLTAIFIGLIMIPIISIAAIFAVRTYNDLVQDSIQDQTEATQVFGTLMSRTILDRVDELKLLNQAFSLEALPLQQQEDVLNNLLLDRRAYEQITILNSDGSERLSVGRFIVTDSDAGSSLTDDLFQAVNAAQDVQFSQLSYDAVTREPFMTIGVPNFDLRTGDISSVIIAEFRFRLIWDLVVDLQSRPAYEKFTIFLVDNDGLVVAHANPSVVLSRTAFKTPSENGRAQGLDGDEELIVSQDLSVGNVQFEVVSERSVSEALQPVVNTFTYVGLVTIVALIIAAILVAVVVGQVVAPIEALSHTAQAIQAGDLKARADVRRRDEIGILAQSFNGMAARLQNFIQTLEERVSERVRDLNVASQVSRQLTTQLNRNKLLSDVTDLTAEAFAFYNVSIFLYDKDQHLLTLQQSSSKASQDIVATGKSFKVEEPGIVPEAARKLEAVMVNDTSQSSQYIYHPSLPNTKAELAVPMIYQGELLGVLDLQDEQVNRFQSQDIPLMTTLAEQIAVAVHNAQLFEEVQIAQETAERSSKVKSAFLASMSHELRTPLNAVINFTRFIMDGDTGPVTEQQVELLSEVVSSAKHLLSLINDVLDMSKIESGSLTLFVEDNIDVNSILNTAITTGQGLLIDKTVRLYSTVTDKLPPIQGDRQRILQILLNIVSNACKFTEEGEIKVAAEYNDKEILIVVTDTGPGIELEEQALIFEPFKQTRTGMYKGGGTGLGMPIAKNLVEAHGGRLWLKSQPEQGTTFYVALPIRSGVAMAVVS